MRLILLALLTACAPEAQGTFYAPEPEPEPDVALSVCDFEDPVAMEDCNAGCGDVDHEDAREFGLAACDDGQVPGPEDAPEQGDDPWSAGYRQCWTATAVHAYADCRG